MRIKKLFSLMKRHSINDGYRTSRTMYILEAAFEYFISICMSGNFLATLTSHLGFSDGTTAVISNITAFAGTFQLISIYLAHKAPVKRWVIPIQFTSHLIMCSLFLVPFLGIGTSGKTVIFFIAILAARVLATVVSPLKSIWFMNLVPMRERGNYTAILQIVSLITGAGVSYGAAAVMEHYKETGDLETAFIIFSVFIFVFMLLHAITLIVSKEKPREETTEKKAAFSSVKTLFKRSVYRKILLINWLYAIANSVITPFLATYQNNQLKLSLVFINTVGIFISIFGVFTTAFFGRLSRNFQHKTILKIAYPIITLAYFCNMFAVPANAQAMYIVYMIILRIGSSALAVSNTNIVLEVIPIEEQTAALSLSTIITGVSGFFVTLAISPFVDYMLANGNQLFGRTVYAQQILSGVNVFFNLLVILCYFLVLLPELNGKENRILTSEKELNAK